MEDLAPGAKLRIEVCEQKRELGDKLVHRFLDALHGLARSSTRVYRATRPSTSRPTPSRTKFTFLVTRQPDFQHSHSEYDTQACTDFQTSRWNDAGSDYLYNKVSR